VTATKRTIAALLLWLGVAIAFYFIIGASTYPQWWKRFLLGGGIAHFWYWEEGVSALGQTLTSFTPAGAVAIGLVLALLAWAMSSLIRRAAGHETDLIPRPPRKLVLLAGFLSCITLLSLPFVKGEYWSLEDVARRLAAVSRDIADLPVPGLWGVLPPPSGTFLYVDRQQALEQYAALHDTLTLTTETSKRLSESTSTATATVPNVGSLGREEKVGSETSAIRTAPSLTPIAATVRLIEKFRRDRGAVQLFEAVDDNYEHRALIDGLKKRGVVLSATQESQLIQGEIALWEEKTLKLRDRRPMFFHGGISVLPGKGTAELAATARGPLVVRLSGRLNPADFAGHVRHCLAIGTPSCDFASITLFGVIETVESPSDRVRKVTILPIAIW